MRIPRLVPELPLLRRELTELSARKRTYVVRSLGAMVLLAWVLWVSQNVLSAWQQQQQQQRGMWAFGGALGVPAASLMGAGEVLFPRLVPLLFLAVQLLMPSMVCGSITIEKERNTLGTLFVTRLTPLTIVFEKLLSRLVPMLTFLLLTFPMLAFVYSLGGVDQRVLLATIWLILWECLLYASIGLMCSAWYTTTVGAFVASYVLSAVIFTLIRLNPSLVPTPYVIWQLLMGALTGPFGWQSGSIMAGAAVTSFAARAGQEPIWVTFVLTIPAMLTVVFCVMTTRFLLYRRAFVSQSSLLLRAFRMLDSFFQRLNDRAGGVQIIADRESYPDEDPVTWREREKKSMGRARYLIRILVVLEFPTLFVCLMSVMYSVNSNTSSGLTPLWLLAWLLALMIVTVKGSTLISSERTRETLDALLSTPMTGRDILLQKVAGMRRLLLVLATPILTVNLTLVMMTVQSGLGVSLANLNQLMWLLAYAVLSVFSTWTTLQLLAWLAVLVGSRARAQARSVFTAVTVALGLAGVSWFVVGQERIFAGQLEQRGALEITVGNAVRQLFRIDGSLQATQSLLWSMAPRPYGYSIESLEGLYDINFPLLRLFLCLGVVAWHWILQRTLRALVLRRSQWLLGRVDESEWESGAVKSVFSGVGR